MPVSRSFDDNDGDDECQIKGFQSDKKSQNFSSAENTRLYYLLYEIIDEC